MVKLERHPPNSRLPDGWIQAKNSIGDGPEPPIENAAHISYNVVSILQSFLLARGSEYGFTRFQRPLATCEKWLLQLLNNGDVDSQIVVEQIRAAFKKMHTFPHWDIFLSSQLMPEYHGAKYHFLASDHITSCRQLVALLEQQLDIVASDDFAWEPFPDGDPDPKPAVPVDITIDAMATPLVVGIGGPEARASVQPASLAKAKVNVTIAWAYLREGDHPLRGQVNKTISELEALVALSQRQSVVRHPRLELDLDERHRLIKTCELLISILKQDAVEVGLLRQGEQRISKLSATLAVALGLCATAATGFAGRAGEIAAETVFTSAQADELALLKSQAEATQTCLNILDSMIENPSPEALEPDELPFKAVEGESL